MQDHLINLCDDKLKYAENNGYSYELFFKDFSIFNENELNKIKSHLETINSEQSNKFIEYIDKISNDKDKLEFEALQKEVTILLALKKENELSELIVKYIKQHYNILTTKTDIKSEMWIYDIGIYIPNGESHIREVIRKVLGELYTPQKVNRVVEKIKVDTYIKESDLFNTNYVDEIPVQNGILNVKTKTLSKFTPDKIFFNKLPMKYDPSKKCPNIDKFFNDIFEDKENVNVMYELFGYCLYKDHFIEKSVMFVGNGRNGKSKTISLLKTFLGIENCCSVPLIQLQADSFSVCNLFGKLANIAGDLDSTSLKSTGLFKQITGRDVIGAKRKFLTDLNFVNYSKQIFACNELPIIYDKSVGFWSRWILFEFPYKFVKQTEYDEAQDKSMLKIIDTEIIDKLTTPEELSGLLNKALGGLNNLFDKKDFSYSAGLAEVKEMWIRKSDSFMAFCMDFVEPQYDGYVPKKTIRQMFSDYIKKHVISGASDKAIKARLENDYGVSEVKTYSNKHKELDGEHCWYGIKLKENIWYRKLDEDYEKNGKNTVSRISRVFPLYTEFSISPLGSKTVDTLDMNLINLSILYIISQKSIVTFKEIVTTTKLQEDKILEILTNLKQKGEIFEPKPYTYKKL